MGVLARLFGRRTGREQGIFAAAGVDPEEKSSRLPPLPPTAGTPRPVMPPPTPTTRPLQAPGTTAGTRAYRAPGLTPSTRRISNPTHPGR